MTDAAIVNATARRAQLVADTERLAAEIEVARKEIARIDTFIQEWKRFAGGDTATLGGGNATLASAPAKAPKPNNPRKEVVGEVIRAYLLGKGLPAGRKELMKALLDHGIDLAGKDPDMVLSTMMWRMKDKFVRLPKFGYWLADQACPAADYRP